MDYRILVNFVLKNKNIVNYLLSLDERDKNKLITLIKESYIKL